MISKLFKQMFRHKLITGIILLIICGGYFGYQSLSGDKNTMQYITAAVEKGTLVVSVSGSGQVIVLDQIDIKPKVSGEVVYVGVENNQEVKKGTLIAQLDTRDAQKSVWDAEINLANAEKNQNIKETAEESLVETYEDALDSLTSTFTNLSSMMPVLENMFLESSQKDSDESDIDYYLHLVRFYLGAYGSDLNQLSFWSGSTQDEAEQKYIVIQKQFDAIREKYSALSYGSSYSEIEIVLDQTYNMTRILLDLVRQSSNVVQKYQALIETENLISPISTTISDSHASQLNEFTSSLISYVNNLLSIKQSVADEKEVMANVDLDIETQSNTIKKLEYALSDAKENLVQHYIRAPFEGIVTKVDVKKGDSVSSGTTLATLITKQKIAEISLNEIDAAKVKIGQKATLTFDALPEISISGRVIEVDVTGTVTQGVVSYGVKIAFDIEEEQIKPGMSVTVEIITDSKQDVLILQNSAIKFQGDARYVELLVSEEIRQQVVEIGLSNDVFTEIISGLKQGDIVVTSIISSSNSQTTTQTRAVQTQGFQIPGMTGQQMGIR